MLDQIKRSLKNCLNNIDTQGPQALAALIYTTNSTSEIALKTLLNHLVRTGQRLQSLLSEHKTQQALETIKEINSVPVKNALENHINKKVLPTLEDQEDAVFVDNRDAGINTNSGSPSEPSFYNLWGLFSWSSTPAAEEPETQTVVTGYDAEFPKMVSNNTL